MDRTNRKQNQTVRLSDIAERLGVSTSAVSFALGKSSNRHLVSKATRERIQQAAREVGYQPNGLARSFRLQRTDMIGLYCDHSIGLPVSLHPFYARLIGGCQEACARSNKDLTLLGLNRERAMDDIFSECADGRVDGIIVFAKPENQLLALLAESRRPAISIVDGSPLLPSVVVDDAGGARMIFDHINQRGYEQIIMVYDPHVTASSLLIRRSAFLATAKEHHRTVVSAEVEVFQKDETTRRARIAASVLPLLRSGKRSVVVTWMDALGHDVIIELQSQGFRIPEEVGVTGFDNLPNFYQKLPQLTTIHAAWDEVAVVAVNKIIEQLAGKEVMRETIIPVRFVPGETA